jgi:hypothetical protein
MRPLSPGLRGTLLTLAAFSGIGCSDALPTESNQTEEIVYFALSEDAARAFGEALADVRGRILPELKAAGPDALAPLLDELTGAIATRNQMALRRAVTRMEIVLNDLNAGDHDAAIATELDVVRFVLEHAQPLAYGPGATAKQ